MAHRGFQNLDPEKVREIARKGGLAGKGYKWTSEKAREAAKKAAESRAKKKAEQKFLEAL